MTFAFAQFLQVLRKDFIVHEFQVYESYNLGADLVLLIAACLSAAELRRLHRAAQALGLRPLVEIHNEEDLDKALAAEPRLIGINNRDLKTFAVDWTTSLRLRPLVPAGVGVISESGIRSHEQILALKEAGFAGVPPPEVGGLFGDVGGTSCGGAVSGGSCCCIVPCCAEPR